MNTANPLPPHGSEGRYKGTRSGSRPPCRCALCTRANRLAGIRRERARAAGEELLISCDILRPHILNLQASKMSQALIARHAHVSQTTISYIISGKIQSCMRAKALGILAVRPGDFDALCERPALGSCRRTQALYASAHGRESISAACGLSVSTVGQIANNRYQLIDGRNEAAIRLAYRLLGDTPGPSHKARRRAQKQGWAPIGAWDEETIDDPDARPDWTGHCGTDRGWWTHRLNHLPMCPRCENAHREWRSEHRGLPQAELMRHLAAARAQASHRGADIADDGRELLRHGCDYDDAAARIGVSREYLQQELQRHPEGAAA